MSRRVLAFALVATSFVIAACAGPTAPRREDTNCIVHQGSSGINCD